MKKTKLPSLVVVLIMTLTTVIVWVSFNVYRALTTKPAPVVPDKISKPLSPNLDIQLLNQINSRTFFDDSQIPEINPTQGSLPTPAPSIPISSPSAIPSASPATESGSAI